MAAVTLQALQLPGYWPPRPCNYCGLQVEQKQSGTCSREQETKAPYCCTSSPVTVTPQGHHNAFHLGRPRNLQSLWPQQPLHAHGHRTARAPAELSLLLGSLGCICSVRLSLLGIRCKLGHDIVPAAAAATAAASAAAAAAPALVAPAATAAAAQRVRRQRSWQHTPAGEQRRGYAASTHGSG